VFLKLAVCVMLLGGAVQAQAHADDGSALAFKTFGLEGVWSPDCRKPPSETNPRVVWRDPPDGPIFHGVTFDGVTWALTDTVSGAVILGDDLIRFSSVRNGKVFATATVKVVGDRIHTITSVGANGQIYVRDGVDGAGKPTLADERCDTPVPIS